MDRPAALRVEKRVRAAGHCRPGYRRGGDDLRPEGNELYGHVKGTFTGADRNRVGRFEAAYKGDIFLDEIGVIPIHLPPLRDRREDIPRLVNTFIYRIRLKTEKPITGMSDDAMGRLYGYAWPGNVSELINAIEYAFVICPCGVIEPSHLPPDIGAAEKGRRTPAEAKPPERENKSPAGPQDAKQRLLDALDQAGGNKSEAARILGISRVYLYKQLKKYDVRADRKVRG